MNFAPQQPQGLEKLWGQAQYPLMGAAGGALLGGLMGQNKLRGALLGGLLGMGMGNTSPVLTFGQDRGRMGTPGNPGYQEWDDTITPWGPIPNRTPNDRRFF